MSHKEILEALAMGKTLIDPEINERFKIREGATRHTHQNAIVWTSLGVGYYPPVNLAWLFLHILRNPEGFRVEE